MSDMQELLTVEQADHVVRLAALALPAAGVVAGTAVGAVRRQAVRGLALGLLCGMIGPAIWGLWVMYGAVVGRYGLDSVKGLLVNIALFVAIGVAVGLGVGLTLRRLGHCAGEGGRDGSQ
jgi:hypothetical protein